MNKQRNLNRYIEYDYEGAYKNQLTALDELFIRQLISTGKIRSIYCTKEIRAGDQFEVEIYPEFSRKQMSGIPPDGLKKKDRKAQYNLNDKNSRKRCERLINANFSDRDIWATFTYSNLNIPKTIDDAIKNMKNYIKRLNYQRHKQGLKNAKYIYVTEYSSNGRCHHHIVMSGDISMDVVESLWKLGKRNEVRRLEKDENGLSGMANYITKDKKGKGQKMWTSSRGLKKPDERKNHYKFKAHTVDKLVRGQTDMQTELAKWYDNYSYTRHEIRYNDFNGRFYVYARMRKAQYRCRSR